MTSGTQLSIDRLPIDLANDFAFDLTLDGKVKQEGPVVAFGSIPPGRNQAEPSLLLQMLKRDAVVVSGVQGRVVTVKDQTQETCDYEIIILPGSSDTPAWEVSYDHVKDVMVTVGQEVQPGTVLGHPGSLMLGCSGPGRVELQVNSTSDHLAHCPLEFLKDRAAAETALKEVMSAWNQQTKQVIYTTESLAKAGCATATTMP